MYFDSRTIVTLDGFYCPFVTGGQYMSSAPKKEEITLEINEKKLSPEDLRILLSLKLTAGKEDLIIPEERFFSDKWELSPYEKKNLGDFLKSVTPVMLAKSAPYLITTVEKKIVVMGYSTEIFKIISGGHFKIAEEPSKFKPFVEGYSTNSYNNREIEELRKNVGIQTEEAILVGTYGSKFVVSVYEPSCQEEMDLILKYLHQGNSPAMIHCLVVSQMFKSANKPMYSFFKKQTTAKVRDICAPNEEIKEALRHLLIPLNSAYARKDTNQFAYALNCSIKNNALCHVDKKYLLTCDIKQFFDSCNWKMTEKYLRFLMPRSLDDKALEAFQEMIINPKTGGLYLGNPVSGALTNAIMRSSSRWLERIFAKENKTFSIYADDITVGSDEPMNKKNVTGKIRFVFETNNLPFILKPEKTHLSTNNKRRITGVRINHLNEATIDRSKYRLLRSMLHRLKNGKEITINDSKLMGNIAYFRFIDDSNKIERLLFQYRDVLKEHGINFKDWKEEYQLSLQDAPGGSIINELDAAMRSENAAN
jgi:hypothetical protein